jgi:putative hydrolase of the HAD superfamily
VDRSATPGYRAVLFDALGTLIDLEPPWPSLRRTLERRFGVDVSEEHAKRAVLAEMAYYRAHHQEGSDAASLRDLRRRCARVLQEQLPATAAIELDALTEVLLESLRFTPFPDAAPALVALRAAGLRLAVVSNWDCSLRSVLSDLGLAAAVDAVVVSAQAGAAKPDGAIFAAALEELRCRAPAAVFVGDSLETDVAGARSAGLRAFLLDRSAGAGDQGDGVERIFSLQDLVQLVEPRVYT